MKRLISITTIFLLSASIAIAQDICESDFDCNGAVDANDVTTFLEDFGRSQYNNPCPPCVPPLIVPKTGQTESYAIGDDGYWQKGYERFTDNLDGTVTDNLTGLIWTKNANCFQGEWEQALSYCNGLANGSCELVDNSVAGDWRLPNVNELRSLVGTKRPYHSLPIGHPFANVQWDTVTPYWSSTTYEYDTYDKWYVHMSDGEAAYHGKGNINHVWPVRGGH